MVRKNNKLKEYLFVDGYNIINAWEKLKQLSNVNLELARKELIEILVEYQHYSEIDITVVFDAHLVKGNSGESDNVKGLKIVYTKANETADQYIERVLDDIGRIKKVRVATTDWMEQQIILGRGGIRVSARELEMEIYNENRMMKRRRKSNNEKNDLSISGLNEETINCNIT